MHRSEKPFHQTFILMALYIKRKHLGSPFRSNPQDGLVALDDWWSAANTCRDTKLLVNQVTVPRKKSSLGWRDCKNFQRDILFEKHSKIGDSSSFLKPLTRNRCSKVRQSGIRNEKVKTFHNCFFHAAREKIDKSDFNLQSKTLKFLWKLKLFSRPSSFHYFTDQWPLVTSNSMHTFFTYLSWKPLLKKEEASFWTM